MAITQKEIAERLGVSRQLVGFALSGSDLVATETRRRINEAALEMGYRPNASATAMKRGDFGCVALLFSTDENRSALPYALLDGIQDELAEHDMHLMLARLPDDKLTDEGVVPKVLREWMSDGLLIDYTHHIPARLIDLIRRHELPAVWLNSKQKNDCVYPHDYKAGQRAAQHLLDLGHRRIAYADFVHVPGDADEHYSATDRRRGYEVSMQKAGLKPNVIEGTPVPHGERLAFMAHRLAKANRPTGLIGYSQTEAELALVAAATLGLSVPRDLSILTFGPATANIAGLRLTSQVVPDHKMGRAAVLMLRRKIAEPSQALPPQRIDFGFEAGETCAPPKTKRI